ncbi:MAG TPA: ABC transporter permease [Thermoanaerobaculia bacterium]|nr:ABC transporter permease [Thermoanaerobaculia bacterium]
MKTHLKLALKVLARRKTFTAISLFGIAMTLAVLMVATAVLDDLFAPGAPETRFDRTLVVYTLGQYGDQYGMTSTPGYGFLDRFVRTLPNIEKASIFSTTQSTAIYRDGARIDTMLKRADGAYWQILDFRFIEGAPFSARDDESGRQVAVITDEMRAKLFDGAPAVGRTIDLDGRAFRVVGVVPRVPFTRFMAYSQVWVPIGTMKSSEYRTQMIGDFSGAVLARDRADFPALKREFESRLPRVPSAEGRQFKTTRAGLDTPFEGFARMVVGNRNADSTATTRVATVLGVLALAFMALPAVNLITLNLSRILERSSEIGVRRAFGAPRSALVRQFVFENVVMTAVGGVGGFVLAAALLPMINRLAPVPDMQLMMNLRVFGFGMLLALFFGVLSGVYPAWRMSRLHPVNALRGGTQ